MLHRPVSKALVDIRPSLIVKDDELSSLKELASCLKPLKMGVKKLCEHGANLLKADGVFKFILAELDKQHSVISQDMMEAIRTRIGDRRLSNIVSLYR